MRVLAALAVGIACALLAGACFGRLPELRPWRARTTSGRIRRRLAKTRVASPVMIFAVAPMKWTLEKSTRVARASRTLNARPRESPTKSATSCSSGYW